MGFLDDISNTISDFSQGAIQKGKDFADVAKYNSMISDEQKKIRETYAQIGRIYYEQFRNAPAEQLRSYIEQVNASNAKLAEYHQKVKELKGVTKCPSCGAEVANGAQFCPGCGLNVAADKASSDGKKHCAACGAAIAPGNKFCTSCGRPV